MWIANYLNVSFLPFRNAVLSISLFLPSVSILQFSCFSHPPGSQKFHIPCSSQREVAHDWESVLCNSLLADSLNKNHTFYPFLQLSADISPHLFIFLDLPIPLAGQFVSPPLKTGSAGHAWVSLDEHCHLHYQIVVTGLGRAEDAALNAHLHGFAELGEVSDNSNGHKRLLKGFYGSEVSLEASNLGPMYYMH